MSHWLDERAHNHRHLLRRVRMFLANYVYDADIQIRQGAPGASPTPPSVGAGEVFVATGPLAVVGRLRLTCTTGGGAGTAQFSLAYTTQGSPPGDPSPTPIFSSTLTAGQPFQENDVYLFITTTVNWVVGNVIDIDFEAGTNTTPWTDRLFVDDQGNSPNFSGDIQTILQGPGDGSPQSFITIGMRNDEDAGQSRYNLQMNAFDAFTDTSPITPYDSQPNKSPNVFAYCDLNISDFWLTVNSRRFILLQRIASGRWNALYGGFMLPLAGEASYAYPIVVGGMSENNTYTSATVDVKLSAFWDPGADFTAPPASPERGGLFLRNTAGAYQDFWNKTDGSAEPGNVSNANYDNVVWPWAAGHNVGDLTHRTQYPSSGDPGNIQNIARTWFYDTGESPIRLARAYVPIQSILYSNDFAGGASQILGFLDGVYFVSGLNNSQANTFTLESPEVTYLVAQNAYRASSESYAAIRMDP